MNIIKRKNVHKTPNALLLISFTSLVHLDNESNYIYIYIYRGDFALRES